MSCEHCERFVRVVLCENCNRMDNDITVVDRGLTVTNGDHIITEHANDLEGPDDGMQMICKNCSGPVMKGVEHVCPGLQSAPFDDPLPDIMLKIPEGIRPGPEHKFDWVPPLEEEATRNPKDVAGTTRAPLQLLPTAGKIAQALAHLDGAEKYGIANWRNIPIEFMGYLGDIEEHIELLKGGVDHDPKSGVHHLGHIMATCAILLDAQEAGTLVDDRPVFDQINNASESEMLARAETFLTERTPNAAVAPAGIGRQSDGH